MPDIRLIKIHNDGSIELTSDYMHQTISGRDAAIQRYVICFMTTVGTLLEAPGWGGSGMTLLMAKKKSNAETEQKVANVIASTQSSLDQSEARNDDYRIVGSTLIEILRDKSRGYSIKIRLRFQNATPTEITIPGDTNVAF